MRQRGKKSDHLSQFIWVKYESFRRKNRVHNPWVHTGSHSRNFFPSDRK